MVVMTPNKAATELDCDGLAAAENITGPVEDYGSKHWVLDPFRHGWTLLPARQYLGFVRILIPGAISRQILTIVGFCYAVIHG